MTLFQLALSALRRHFPGQREADDAYLAGAVDIHDLERRMRQIDRHGIPQPLHLRHLA